MSSSKAVFREYEEYGLSVSEVVERKWKSCLPFELAYLTIKLAMGRVGGSKAKSLARKR